MTTSNNTIKDSCAECGVLAPDHAPNCGSVSMGDDTCAFRDYDDHQCQRKAGHSGLHDTTGHICDPSATPPITPESCPACLAVDMSATKSTFTPGPWRVSKETGIRYIRAADNHIISTAYSMLNGVDNAAKELEADANARLIAAAPDLYAVLKAFGPYLSTEQEMLNHAAMNDGQASPFDVASIQVRRALALVEVK